MRKRLTYVSAILATAAVMAVAVVAVVAGGGASGTAEAAKAGDEAPRAILEKAIAADRDVTSGRADFEATLTADLDPSVQAPAQARMILDKPIVISGSVAVDSDPFAGSMTVEIALGDGGFTTETAARWIDDQAWIKIMGTWYEAPPEMREQLAEAQTQIAAGKPETCPLEETGLDPWAWITGLTVKGTEQVAGSEAYRIAGGLDVQTLLDDAIAFAATPQFEELLEEHAPPEAVEEFRVTDRAEMEDAAAQAASVVRDVRGDVWVATDTYRVVKAAGSATIVPPAEADAAWLRSMDVVATITCSGFGEPLTVEAPEGALPWEDLQKLSGGACEAPMLAD